MGKLNVTDIRQLEGGFGRTANEDVHFSRRGHCSLNLNVAERNLRVENCEIRLGNFLLFIKIYNRPLPWRELASRRIQPGFNEVIFSNSKLLNMIIRGYVCFYGVLNAALSWYSSCMRGVFDRVAQRRLNKVDVLQLWGFVWCALWFT